MSGPVFLFPACQGVLGGGAEDCIIDGGLACGVGLAEGSPGARWKMSYLDGSMVIPGTFSSPQSLPLFSLCTRFMIQNLASKDKG